MILSQAKSLVIPLLVAGSVVTTGVGVAAYQTSRDGPQTQPSPAPSPSLAVMKKQSGQPNPLASRLPERVEAVKAILGDFEKRMAAGEWNDPEAYDNWSLRLFQLERSTAPQDSSAPYEGHAERMRKMLRTAEALRNAGRLTSLDVSRWDYFSMEAGQMLESQKGDIANVAGAQSVPGLISSSRGQGTIGSARAGPAPPDQPEGNPPPGQPPKQWVAGHAPIGHRGLDDTFGAEDAPDNSGDYIKIIRMAAAVAKWDKNPNTQAVLKRLDQPMTLRFPQETPLEDILKFIKQAIQTPNGSEIAIYVDPLGLQEADKTLSSPIQIDLDGVPLRFSLRLMLKQLGMAYCVHDGVLIISSVDGIKKELEEAQAELEELNRPSSPGGGLQ